MFCGKPSVCSWWCSHHDTFCSGLLCSLSVWLSSGDSTRPLEAVLPFDSEKLLLVFWFVVLLHVSTQNAPVCLCIRPVVSVRSAIINKCQCASSTGSHTVSPQAKTEPPPCLTDEGELWDMSCCCVSPHFALSIKLILFHQSVELCSSNVNLFLASPAVCIWWFWSFSWSWSS